MATGDALLALLLPGPRHGYDLKRAHDEWFTGLRPLAFAQVYSTLGRLERDGFVQVAHTEAAGGPERTIFELTSSGRARVRAWLAEPTDPNVPGGPAAEELIRKILAAYHLKGQPDRLMARQRTAHLRAIRALESTAPTDSGASETYGSPAGVGLAVMVDHQRIHLDADLRWLELTGERLRRQPAPAVDPLLGPIPDHLTDRLDPANPTPDLEPDSPSESEDADLTLPIEGARP